MNKEINLKKFLLFLSGFLVILAFVLYFVLSRMKPFCKPEQNPCKSAICNQCIDRDGKKICSDCNLYNQKEEKIWTGGCVYNE